MAGRARRAVRIPVVAARAAMSFCCLVTTAAAGEREPRIDVFSGIEATANAASGYVGGSVTLGNSLYDPGVRLKAALGYGHYAYDGGIALDGKPVAARIRGDHGFVEAALGYQFRLGPATVRPYLGVQNAAHLLSPADPRNPVRGHELGAKLALESWLDIGPRLWASLDGSYTTAFDEYRAFGRIGTRLTGRLAAGLEGGALGNRAYDEGRGGGFLELKLGKTAVTVSGGVSGDYLGREPSAYGAFALYRAF